MELTDIAARAVYERLRAVAVHVGDEVADTTWKNDAGPSFAVRVADRSYRVIVSAEPDEIGVTFVYGPYAGGDDWIENAVEGSQNDPGEPAEIIKVDELEPALG